MARSLVSFIVSQRKSGDKVPLSGLITILDQRLEQGWSLPLPYRIYGEDESKPPGLGFPVARSRLFETLREQIERWLEALLLDREGSKPEADPAQLLESYIATITPVVENAMLSKFLADYHAIFWLGHSADVAEIFGSFRNQLARHGGTMGGNPARLQFRIYGLWVERVREALAGIEAKLAHVLEGDGSFSVEFFDQLADNALIFTSTATDPDLRGARLWVEGARKRRFRDVLEILDSLASEATGLAERSPGFAWSLESIGAEPSQIDRFSILDPTLRGYLLGHPEISSKPDEDLGRTVEETCNRVLEFEILDRLRRAIVWTDPDSEPAVVALERSEPLSPSTRPLTFDRTGVVDPIVHRFGLVYDLSAFSETLGEIARAGVRRELLSYRQMFLFQKRLDRITRRNRLKFEKFLGDGAFYTTRHAIGLVTAAIEIQSYYSEMRSRGFLFDRGLRIALNYGYYRLLPLNDAPESSEPLIEFYGPGIVELSRLTTGKSTRDIADLTQHLIAHGYEAEEVRRFFAPLEEETADRGRGTDEREFFARLDRNRNLVNEGIVAAWSLIDELDRDLRSEEITWGVIETPYGPYVCFPVPTAPSRLVGLKSLGSVNLKGLRRTEVVEVGSFEASDYSPELTEDDSLAIALRRLAIDEALSSVPREEPRLALCATGSNGDSTIILGKLDPSIDTLEAPVRISASELEHLLGITSPIDHASLADKGDSLTDLYKRLSATEDAPPIDLGEYRKNSEFRVMTIAAGAQWL